MRSDAFVREFCRPPDQTLLALAADERVGQLVAADSFRSYIASVARRRSWSLVEDVVVGGRAMTRARPHRLRTVESTQVRTVARAYRRYGELLGRALAHARGEAQPRPESAALVTYSPLAAAFCDAPWISNVVYFGQDDWATGEGVHAWWDLFEECYRRI